MDKFLKKNSTNNTGHEGNVPPKKRAKQYEEGCYYADGDKMFCRPCNTVVNHIRKSVCDAHLASSKHLANAAEVITTSMTVFVSD